eukprot:Opistho-2@25721
MEGEEDSNRARGPAPSRPLPAPKPAQPAQPSKPLPKPPGPTTASPTPSPTAGAPASSQSPVSSPKPALRPKPNLAALPAKGAGGGGASPLASPAPSSGTQHVVPFGKPAEEEIHGDAEAVEPSIDASVCRPTAPLPRPPNSRAAPSTVIAQADEAVPLQESVAPAPTVLTNPTPGNNATASLAKGPPVSVVPGKGLPPAPRRAPPPPPPGATPVASSPRPSPSSSVRNSVDSERAVDSAALAAAVTASVEQSPPARRPPSFKAPVPPASAGDEPVRKKSAALVPPTFSQSLSVDATSTEPVRKKSFAPSSPLPVLPVQEAASAASTAPVALPMRKQSIAPSAPLPELPRQTEEVVSAVEGPIAAAAEVVVEDDDGRRLVVAMWSNDAQEDDEISFKEGDVFEVTNTENSEWWVGVANGKTGVFPSVYVKLIDKPGREKSNSMTHDSDDGTDVESAAPPKETPPRKLTPEEMRVRVMMEIFTTEKDYVDDLKLVIEGYEKKMIERKNVPEDVLEVLFGNIDEIYDFQQKFLVTMQHCMQPEAKYETQLGKSFLVHKDGFKIYSDYCNNHPRACEEMVRLLQEESLKAFFLGCRLLVDADISLEGFLLTPIQRICKYPLLLKELLKYTPEGHPDHANVNAALDGMKEVAMLINETKRRMENLEKISEWQHTIDGYQGPDITSTSTELILEGSLVKISSGRAQERYFFLFDNVLIYTRKDFLKTSVYIFKGRIPTDGFEVVDINDGEVTLNGSKVSNCWKVIRRASKNKSYVLIAKTPEEKKKWLDAFALEREKAAKADQNGTQPQRRMQVEKPGQKELKSSPSLRRKDSAKEKKAAPQPLAKTVVKKGLFAGADKSDKSDKKDASASPSSSPLIPAFGNVMKELQQTRGQS